MVYVSDEAERLGSENVWCEEKNERKMTRDQAAEMTCSTCEGYWGDWSAWFSGYWRTTGEYPRETERGPEGLERKWMWVEEAV